MKRIYLDYAATTPVDPQVLGAMLSYLKNQFGNAGSIHSFGRDALAAVDISRQSIAEFLAAKPEEIIFTSGATESINLAIKGLTQAMRTVGYRQSHIITSQFEHHAVLETCQALERDKLAKVTYLRPSKDGFVNALQIQKAIQPNTILVSIMYVNNEIGTIQPIREIGKMLQKINKNRQQKIYFHTDAVQAVQFLNCNVDYLKVDLLSLSAHKIYGPKGIGALYVRSGAPLHRQQDGGEQEGKKRAGTLNVAGIVGLGKAVKLIKLAQKNISRVKHSGVSPIADSKYNDHIASLRDLLWARIRTIKNVKLNGSLRNRLPNNLNISFDGAEGEGLLISLGLDGVAVSTGSACSSNSLSPSHVLLAIGKSEAQAHSSLRITIGKFTTRQEIETAAKLIKKHVARLRRISGAVYSSTRKSRAQSRGVPVEKPASTSVEK